MRVHSTQGGCGVVLQKRSRETERNKLEWEPPMIMLLSINSKEIKENVGEKGLKDSTEKLSVKDHTHQQKRDSDSFFSFCLLLGDVCAIKVYIF